MCRIVEMKSKIQVARSKAKGKSMKMGALMVCAKHVQIFQSLYETGSLGTYNFKTSQVILLCNQDWGPLTKNTYFSLLKICAIYVKYLLQIEKWNLHDNNLEKRLYGWP